jgi:hypothetical protein
MKRTALLCLAAALAVLSTPCLPVAALPVSGTGGIDDSPVVVTGLVEALTISVTHPASAEWTIDVNQGIPFAAPTLAVTNHTRCPVEVSVAGLSRNPIVRSPLWMSFQAASRSGIVWTGPSRRVSGFGHPCSE